MDNIGGAERVCLTLAREFRADIYTTNIDLEKIRKMGFADVLNRIKSIGRLPVNPPFKQQLALKRFKKLKLRGYDFYIIAGDWAVSAAVNHQPNLWYVHSPIREIWDLYRYTKQNIVPFRSRFIFDLWVFYNRYLNRRYVKYVEKLVCNSENTRKRIKKYLNRDAKVINPPIEVSKFKYKKTGGFWLSVNRLLAMKRVDIQIEAFKRLPKEKLVIVGSYEKASHFQKYANHLKKIRPQNVEIKSWIGFQELINLYSECKGFITTSKDEDFGMAPIEAMASGKPVIAPNEGGYKETILNGKTGILIDNIDENKLMKAIKKIKDPKKYRMACLKQAKKFSTKSFIKKMRKEIRK